MSRMLKTSSLSPSPDWAPRLFSTTRLRITSKAEWVEVRVKSVLTHVRGMPFNYSINPYRGCQHGCPFCYARLTHWYLDQDGVNDWSSRIFVKVNAPEVLRRELAKPTWQHEEVHLGTATDPYQPAEGSYKITRKILEVLHEYRTPVTIVTRSPMVVRDVDILQRLAQGPGAMVCFSIATLDTALASEIEPSVASPQKRLEAIQALAGERIPTSVFLAPVLPGLTDHPKQLAALVQAAKAHGASSLWANALHLGEVTKQAFFQYLEDQRSEMLPEYERLYRGKYAPPAYRRHVQEVVAALKTQFGFNSSFNRNDTKRATRSAQRHQLKPPLQLQLL